MNPDEPFVNLDQDDEAGATKTIDNQEMNRIKKQVKARESLDDTLNLRTEKKSRFTSGHRMCAGCGAPVVGRMIRGYGFRK